MFAPPPPPRRAFPISLLVFECNAHGQTWYQKFIGTYPSLNFQTQFIELFK